MTESVVVLPPDIGRRIMPEIQLRRWLALASRPGMSFFAPSIHAQKTNRRSQEPLLVRPVHSLSDPDAQQLVDTMKRILLAAVAVLAFASPSFAAETGKTVGQSPSSFYLAQDTATMKCQIVESQPAGGSMKVVGAAHTTKASAEAALKADKTCAK